VVQNVIIEGNQAAVELKAVDVKTKSGDPFPNEYTWVLGFNDSGKIATVRAYMDTWVDLNSDCSRGIELTVAGTLLHALLRRIPVRQLGKKDQGQSIPTDVRILFRTLLVG
jgi:hypothetical protein